MSHGMPWLWVWPNGSAVAVPVQDFRVWPLNLPAAG